MKLNISIDDVSPHPLSSIKVLERCHEMIEKFPDIKFTLFVPTAYWRTVREGVKTEKPLHLYDYPDFCQSLRNLNKKNFEVGYHGHFHGIPGTNDNDEFHSLTYEEASLKFKEINRVVEESNLREVFSPIFRPPAWRMSPGSILAAKDAGVQVLALSSREYAKSTYGGEDSNFQKVVYYTSAPPADTLSIQEKNELVYHACEWDKNYLSVSLANQLSEWIEKLDKVSFEFIRNLA